MSNGRKKKVVSIESQIKALQKRIRELEKRVTELELEKSRILPAPRIYPPKPWTPPKYNPVGYPYPSPVRIYNEEA